ncbi:type III secretion system inner membrane ring lipoprotein SctJ [uncultured Tateyamaria sp.]|uniref:type III secretion system inner membrane ring lipoprotein SctJ n=1 Tax=uncultured Tateyamaria sp. TaxID=455651 RepID=UPI002611DFE7|nr:type III secretion inner membrane ring lipoprotein SctJ [uncultured Tateyamaria sp.]
MAQHTIRTIRSRVALPLVLAVGLTACKTDLYTGLSERDANEILSVLIQSGLDAQRTEVQPGQITVRIEDAQFAQAVDVLQAQGLPRRDFVNLGDVFQGNGFVVSEMEERARFVYAMSEELSRTITQIDGVISARTHVVLPTTKPLSRDTTPSSASVFIRHAGWLEPANLVPQIKSLVANSIEELAYENVSVVLLPVPEHRPLPRLTPTPDVATLGFASPLVLIAGACVGLVVLLATLLGVWLFRRRRPPAQVETFAIEPAE